MKSLLTDNDLCTKITEQAISQYKIAVSIARALPMSNAIVLPMPEIIPEYGELPKALFMLDIEEYGVGLSRATYGFCVGRSHPLFDCSKYTLISTAPDSDSPEYFSDWFADIMHLGENDRYGKPNSYTDKHLKHEQLSYWLLEAHIIEQEDLRDPLADNRGLYSHIMHYCHRFYLATKLNARAPEVDYNRRRRVKL